MPRPKKKAYDMVGSIGTPTENLKSEVPESRQYTRLPRTISSSFTAQRGQEQENITLGDGKWFKTDYQIERVKTEYPILISSGPKTTTKMTTIDVPFISPKPSAKLEAYAIESKIQEAALSLCNDLRLPPELMDYLVMEVFAFEPENSLDFIGEAEPHFLEVVIPFVNEFGLLGYKFKEISHFKPSQRTVIPVSTTGKEFRDIKDWLGPCLKEMNREITPPRFLKRYRESVYDIFKEAMEFATWTRHMINLHPPDTFPFADIESVIARSTPKIKWENEHLLVSYKSSNLIDSCYLWIFDQLANGGANKSFIKTCQNIFCERVFITSNKKQVYCCPEHGSSHRMRESRNRRSEKDDD